MDINFSGKYKSIGDFTWINIPSFVVITGPNGTGKSQLLELIYNTIINKAGTSERVIFNDSNVKPDEVTFLIGEWQLQNVSPVDLLFIQSNNNNYYSQFVGNMVQAHQEQNRRLYGAFQEVIVKTGKTPNLVTKVEFDKYFPELYMEQEDQISQKISEIFYNYRLTQIEHQLEGVSKEDIIKEIGEEPWIILREIIKESKLPFDINDPSKNKIRDSFHLKLTHQISGDNVNFNDLSSGEKVLMSLVFWWWPTCVGIGIFVDGFRSRCL